MLWIRWLKCLAQVMSPRESVHEKQLENLGGLPVDLSDKFLNYTVQICYLFCHVLTTPQSEQHPHAYVDPPYAKTRTSPVVMLPCTFPGCVALCTIVGLSCLSPITGSGDIELQAPVGKIVHTYNLKSTQLSRSLIILGSELPLSAVLIRARAESVPQHRQSHSLLIQLQNSTQL